MPTAMAFEVTVVPAGIVSCWLSATTAVAEPRTASAKRVPAGITRSLFVTPAVWSAALTVTVNCT